METESITKVTKTFTTEFFKETIVEVDGEIKQVTLHQKATKKDWKWLFTLKKGQHFTDNNCALKILYNLQDIVNSARDLIEIS